MHNNKSENNQIQSHKVKYINKLLERDNTKTFYMY